MLDAEAEYLQSYLSAMKFIFHILVQYIEIFLVSVKNTSYMNYIWSLCQEVWFWSIAVIASSEKFETLWWPSMDFWQGLQLSHWISFKHHSLRFAFNTSFKYTRDERLFQMNIIHIWFDEQKKRSPPARGFTCKVRRVQKQLKSGLIWTGQI